MDLLIFLFYFIFSLYLLFLFIYHIYYNEVRLVVHHSLEVWIVWDPFPLEKGSEMFYLTTHSTHFFYSYIASDIWLRTILIVRKETRCCHIGYSYRLTAMVLLYAPSHRQDNTYHSLCYTSCGALAGTRNSSIPISDLIKLFIL